jgi:hypothetical protein
LIRGSTLGAVNKGLCLGKAHVPLAARQEDRLLAVSAVPQVPNAYLQAGQTRHREVREHSAGLQHGRGFRGFASPKLGLLAQHAYGLPDVTRLNQVMRADLYSDRDEQRDLDEHAYPTSPGKHASILSGWAAAGQPTSTAPAFHGWAQTDEGERLGVDGLVSQEPVVVAPS